jgi:hypothetical protein
MIKTAAQRVLLNNGKFPVYSKNSISIFKQFDKLNNTKGRYTTSPNEFYIQELYSDFKFLRFKDTEMNKVLEIKIEVKQ